MVQKVFVIVGVDCKIIWCSIGQFQKISVQYDGRLFGIPKARGGSLNWNSEGKGGTYDWNSDRGVSDLGFPEGTDK